MKTTMKLYSGYDGKAPYNELKVDNKCSCDLQTQRIYIEIIGYNPTNISQPAIFDPQPFSTHAIVNNPSEWTISPIRFSVPSQNTPLAQIPATGINAMGVCISYTGINATGPVTAINDDLDPTFDVDNVNRDYIYNYQTIADSVNRGINTAYLSLTGTAGFTAPFPPFLTYNSTTFQFSLSASNEFDINTTGCPQLFFNDALADRFGNFQSYYYGTNQPNFKDHQLKIKGNGGTSVTSNVDLIVPPLPYVVTATGPTITQNYNSLNNWTIMKSIQFVSRNIPVDPLIQNNLNSPIPNQLNVITNFNVATELGYDTRGFINFTNVGEYRRIDMNGNQPLRNFGMDIRWIDAQQVPHLLLVKPDMAHTSLWMLERKDLNRGHIGKCKCACEKGI